MDFQQFDKAERLEKEGQQDEALLAYTEFINQQLTIGHDERGRAQRMKLALAYNNRGLLRYLQVEFRLASQDFTLALSCQPQLAVAHYNRGLIHYRLSRFSEAVEDLQKAVSLQPDLEPAHQCLRQSLQDRERREQSSP